MPADTDTVQFRVRYSETDRMDAVYNSRVLEWFEVGRTEYTRSMGLTYAEVEERGILLPIVEAHVEYEGRAGYDDLLEMTTTASMPSRLKVRFDVSIEHANKDGRVASGYTLHAVTDSSGKPVRPPQWLLDVLQGGEGTE
ncbi:MAG: thioesterase family protein [Planctomycetota bacterium]